MSAVAGLRAAGHDDRQQRRLAAPGGSRVRRGSSSYAVPLVAMLTRLPEPAVGPRGARRCRRSSSRCWSQLTHHECDNTVCKLVSFTYGSGFPTLWRHENLNEATHEWLKHEFADVPLTFFQQMARCVRRGHLVVGRGPARSCPRTSPRSRRGPTRASRSSPGSGTCASCRRARCRTFEYFDAAPPRLPHAPRLRRTTATSTCSWARTRARDVFPIIGSRSSNDAQREGTSHGSPRRIKRQAGRHALVDGIPFQLPVDCERSPGADGRVPHRRRQGAGAAPGQRGAPAPPVGDKGAARGHGHRLPRHRHRQLHRVQHRHRLHARAAGRRRRCCPRCCRSTSGPASTCRPAGQHRDLGQGRQGHLGHAQAPGQPGLQRRRPDGQQPVRPGRPALVRIEIDRPATAWLPVRALRPPTTASSAAC